MPKTIDRKHFFEGTTQSQNIIRPSPIPDRPAQLKTSEVLEFDKGARR